MPRFDHAKRWKPPRSSCGGLESTAVPSDVARELRCLHWRASAPLASTDASSTSLSPLSCAIRPRAPLRRRPLSTQRLTGSPLVEAKGCGGDPDCASSPTAERVANCPIGSGSVVESESGRSAGESGGLFDAAPRGVRLAVDCSTAMAKGRSAAPAHEVDSAPRLAGGLKFPIRSAFAKLEIAFDARAR